METPDEGPIVHPCLIGCHAAGRAGGANPRSGKRCAAGGQAGGRCACHAGTTGHAAQASHRGDAARARPCACAGNAGNASTACSAGNATAFWYAASGTGASATPAAPGTAASCRNRGTDDGRARPGPASDLSAVHGNLAGSVHQHASRGGYARQAPEAQARLAQEGLESNPCCAPALRPEHGRDWTFRTPSAPSGNRAIWGMSARRAGGARADAAGAGIRPRGIAGSAGSAHPPATSAAPCGR